MIRSRRSGRHILSGSQDAYYDYSEVGDLRAKYAGIKSFKATQVDC